jgi:hypothetical protein
VLKRFVEDRALFKSDRLVAEQWIEHDDCVMVPTQRCGVPKAATAEVKAFVVPVFTLRRDRIVRLDWYGSVHGALKAVGLE